MTSQYIGSRLRPFVHKAWVPITRNHWRLQTLPHTLQMRYNGAFPLRKSQRNVTIILHMSTINLREAISCAGC